MNKPLRKFWQHNTYAQEILYFFYQKAYTIKIFLREHTEFCFGSILVVSIFSMHARRPIRPHMALEPKTKLVPVARLLLVSPYNF
jgi:hypothetical protein